MEQMELLKDHSSLLLHPKYIAAIGYILISFASIADLSNVDCLVLGTAIRNRGSAVIPFFDVSKIDRNRDL
jgi:hypothetical protein